MPERLAQRLDRRLRDDRRASPHGPGRRSTDHEPNHGWRIALLIALTVALTDWLVKWSVVQRLAVEEFTVVWEGRVALWHVQNPAMILGLYGNLPLEARKVIAAFAAVVGALLLFEVLCRGHRLLPSRRKWVWLFTGLAAGGMLGNLGERALHWTVTDYLSFAWRGLWLPPGNVADIAIFLSIPFALVVIWCEIEARAQRKAVPVAESAARGERYRSSALEA
jgi:lipoprotein signal peptidase